MVKPIILLFVSLISSPVMAASDPLRPSLLSGGVVSSVPDVPESTNNWALQSVLSSSGRKVAIINGKTVALGEKIDGAMLTRVEQGTVYLTTEQNSVVKLTLFKDMVKH